ncbi:MAG: RNA 2',3'-cyclic phosphodiesterase [Acidiferrobacterales bacterium]
MGAIGPKEDDKAGRQQRLFLALWPDEDVRTQLEAIAPKVLAAGVGRRVKRENLHATLIFLGSVTAETRTCIEQVAAGIKTRPFSLVLDQAGYWAKPRLAWVEASQLPEPLIRLVADLKAGLDTCGLMLERREYRAHVTLARKVRRGTKAAAIGPIEWRIDSFVLVESHTRPAGVTYEVLRSWRLTGSSRESGKESE